MSRRGAGRWFGGRKRRESLACQELVELVTDYLEGALALEQLRAFETHIFGCGNCTEYLRQMRRTIELERQIGQADAGAGDLGSSTGNSQRMLDTLLSEFRAQHPH